jgi:hypothetical protein
MPSILGLLASLEHQIATEAPVAAVDMSTNAPTILAINGAFTGLALCVVLARIYVRTIMLKTFGIDDGFIVAALVSGFF